MNLRPQPVNLTAQSVNPPPQPVNLPGFVPSTELPADLQKVLTTVKARMPHPELENLVLRLCAWKALSTDELASFLQRNRNYITNRLITPMLRSGKLTMAIPNEPHHPEQKYRTAVPKQT